MKKDFYRISDEKLEALAAYMDDEIREEVYCRYAPCTNEEFLAQVLVRNGITQVQIEEVLNRDFEEVKETCEVINLIKGYMRSYNYIHKAKIRFPGRDFVTEDSAEGEEYKFHLLQFSRYNKALKDLKRGSFVLTDFSNSFPEIDTVFTEDRLLYTWRKHKSTILLSYRHDGENGGRK